MAPDYEDQWDDFLDAYQELKQRSDQFKLLLTELIENLDSKEDKDRYLKAFKEVVHGKD